ncbi:MAG: hypothetical protein FWB77_06405, partial [Treponema sp.]|nr:hypothetical protein [Treponema sp.]
ALIFYNNSYYETAGWIKASDPPVPCEGGTRRDNLDEALGIHYDSKYFTLLREQKSNLWFIRSSKALCEDGFFVALKGYETQVFLDINEVEDDARGRWARLNNDLNGSGVSDLHASIKDIFLGELYYRFNEILKPEIVNGLNVSIYEKFFVDSFREPVIAFIKTAVHYIGGANGAWDPWAVPSKTDSKTNIEFTAIDHDAIWKEFEAYINMLKNILEALKKSKSPLLDRITKCMSERQLIHSVALTYGVISLLRSIIGKEATGAHAENLAFNHWDLGRKIRDAYKFFGASDAEAWRITDLMKAVLRRTNDESGALAAYSWDKSMKNGLKFSASDFAAFIIEENYSTDDFRRILGINFFNDVAWFNKESFEDALFYSSLFFMMETSVRIPIEERIERIAGIYDVLLKAEAKSEYRFDILLDILTGGDAKPKTKANTNKPTAKKIEVKIAPKKAAEKKPAAKKSAVKAKPAEKKAVPKSKPAVKKSPVKKAEPKKATTKKTEVKKPVKKAGTKKTGKK